MNFHSANAGAEGACRWFGASSEGTKARETRMSLIADLKSLEPSQRSAIWASYLGWTLDAFDYFLMVFMFKAIAAEFGTDIKGVTQAVFLTLAARPIGAFVFGWLAERFGRRPVLMADIILFSLFELASGFAPTLTSLLVLRFLFGIAMGGEWGLGASLVMESIPARLRGPVSGLLQSGYPSGYFVASLVYFLLFDRIGWRGMFMVGVAPALLVLLIRMHVKESPVFDARRGKAHVNPVTELVQHWKIALYLVVLMTAFNFFSHGTQDLYPTFLQKQHHFDTHTTGTLDGDHERRRDGRRHRLWHLVGADRAQARDHHRQPPRPAGHPVVGLFRDAAAARRRRRS